MAITSLGYMGIRSAALNDWSDYARRLLGMQQVDCGGGTLCFRMDDWQQRLVVLDEPGDEFAFMGWQVSDRRTSIVSRHLSRISAFRSPRRRRRFVTSGLSKG